MKVHRSSIYLSLSALIGRYLFPGRAEKGIGPIRRFPQIFPSLPLSSPFFSFVRTTFQKPVAWGDREGNRSLPALDAYLYWAELLIPQSLTEGGLICGWMSGVHVRTKTLNLESIAYSHSSPKRVRHPRNKPAT